MQNDECRVQNRRGRAGRSFIPHSAFKRFFGNTGRQAVKRAAIFALLACSPFLVFRVAVAVWPYPTSVEKLPMAATTVLDRSGTPLAAFASEHGDWCLPLSGNEISPHLVDAIVAVEDQRFYDHGGVDWQSALGAGWQDLRSLSLHRGASTITMQLEHLREPSPRSIFSKITQAIRACQIEGKSTKREILVEYLNRAPFGGNLVGAGAASWKYFGRHCADLSLGQAALLAGLPQSPNRFRPDRHPQLAKSRRDHVLDRMLAGGMITAEQRREAGTEPVTASWRPLPQDAEDLGLLPTATRLERTMPGKSIHTTIDIVAQRQAEKAAAEQLASLQSSHVDAAAVVVLDTATGQCLAAVSRSPDTGAQAVDLTIQPRSSGSVLKPLIYAAAFDAGVCTPRTVLDDSPTSWAGYEPSNYDRQFDGPLPAAEALALSRNVPALFVLSKIGVGRAVEVMRGSGLATLAKTPDRYGLSLAIGGAEITPMELAEAYATLARGGRDLSATLLMDRAPGTPGRKALLRGSSCLSVLECIADLERTRRVCASAVNLAPAWKTGTSSGHRDAWCAAVTPRRVVVVWLGNIDGSGSDALVGQDAAAPLALRVLTEVDKISARALSGFAPPPGFLAGAQDAASLSGHAELSLISPVDHQQILRDGTLPEDQQRFPLRAREVGTSADEVWWFVDGQCIGSCSSGDRFWWDPVVGSHEVRVMDSAGRAAAARVEVRQAGESNQTAILPR